MKRSVLLVAYRLDILQTVPITLKLAGVKVKVVESGLDAIRQARSSAPDLVVLDAVLPDMDGATVADILRRLPSTAEIPIVLLRPSPNEEGASGRASFNRSELLLQVAEVLSMCRGPENNRLRGEMAEAPSLSEM